MEKNKINKKDLDLKEKVEIALDDVVETKVEEDIAKEVVITKVKEAKVKDKKEITIEPKKAEVKAIATNKDCKTTSTKGKSSTSKKKVVNKEEKVYDEGMDKYGRKLTKNDLTDFNTYLFHEGKNYESYNILGSHLTTEKRKKGVRFTTWAPTASKIYVVGDFTNFELNEDYILEKVTNQGVWSGFFPDLNEGQKYKYCIFDKNGKKLELKADPYGIKSELRPGTASVICNPKKFKWEDKEWRSKQKNTNVYESPINIYEVHLGSWKRNDDGEFLTYDEIAQELPKYVKEMGFTHVEIMPIVEHPLDASWGYQGTGYYSPTSRFGDLEGVKKLVNELHKAGIAVILDWTPGHFCKDAHGLYHFDGTPTYEYKEGWRAENAGWGTCNFDLGRAEVRSFLISNALYWLREFHMDGIRVDAVSSILYLDYSRNHGEWVPNKFGGNGNLEGIEFFKELNSAVFKEFPNVLMIAEESTAWPNVTKPDCKDGLGFNLKWNMGWMNDTLEYVQIDPMFRNHNHRNITFSMMYNYSENFVLPLSHDEVVHGKKSLLNKMWGDEWNKYSGLRVFISYMMAHPGKKLFFMGSEFAQSIEWREYEGLKWDEIENEEMHKKTQLFFKDINNIYLDNKAMWQLDYDYTGFTWIDPRNSDQSILVFMRRSRDDEDTLLFVVNFKPNVYYDYRIGVPFLGEYVEILNSDDVKYGGSGQVMGDVVLKSEKRPYHNQPYSMEIKVPPMAALVLKVKNIQVDEAFLLDEDEIEEIEKLKSEAEENK